MTLQDAQLFLDRFLPPLENDVMVRTGIPAFMYAQEGCAICAMAAYLRAASSTPGQIILREDLADMDTAGGRALLGHERLHQSQYALIDNLDYLYAREQRRVRGNPPYLNAYEWPAYEVEANIYRAAIAEGFPPGRHMPLLIQDGLG